MTTPHHNLAHQLKAALKTLILAYIVLITASTPALADPAEPTDYESKIVGIEPDFADIELDMIGGDSFIRLKNHGRHSITVIGYRAEPFLRFDTDGSVWENTRAPSRWLSASRYADVVVPATADSLAPPQWAQVSDDATYTWHDHRTHWMNKAKPPVAEPGDRVLELVVPLNVDGVDVAVSVASYILAPPSKVPTAGGIILGGAIALLSLGYTRFKRSLVLFVVSVAALTVGTICFRSVPPITEPQVSLWMLPTMATVAVLAALVWSHRATTTVFLDGFTASASALLIYWSFTRRSALYRSLIPTDLANGLDRFVIAAAFGVSVPIVIYAIKNLLRPKRLEPSATSEPSEPDCHSEPALPPAPTPSPHSTEPAGHSEPAAPIGSTDLEQTRYDTTPTNQTTSATQ